MVKIGRPPKNNGLTKVEARKAAKSNFHSDDEKPNDPAKFYSDDCETGSGDGTVDWVAKKTPSCQLVQTTPSHLAVAMENFKEPKCNGTHAKVTHLPHGARKRCALESNDQHGSVSFGFEVENAINAASVALSRWNRVHDGTIRTKGNPDTRRTSTKKVVKAIENTLDILNDCRYINMEMALGKKRKELRKDKSGPGETTAHPMVIPTAVVHDLNENNILHGNLLKASARLLKDAHFMPYDEATARSGHPRNPPPTIPRVLDTSVLGAKLDRAVSYCPSEVKKCVVSHGDDNENPPFRLLRLEIENITEKNLPEGSPRERLERKIIEHKCSASERRDTSSTMKNDLKNFVWEILDSLEKRARNEKYSSMSRSERRNAMRHDIINGLRPRLLLPKLIRQVLISTSFRGDSAINLHPHLRDVILDAVARNGFQHASLFVKVITSEFIESDLEAFNSRMNYFRLWSWTLSEASKKIEKGYGIAFIGRPHEFSPVSHYAENGTRLAALQLSLIFESLIRTKENKLKEELQAILRRFSQLIRKSFKWYMKICADIITIEIYRKTTDKLYGIEDTKHICIPQVRTVLLLSAIPTFEAKLCSIVDEVLYGLSKNCSTQESDVFLIYVANLLQTVIRHAMRSATAALKRPTRDLLRVAGKEKVAEQETHGDAKFACVIS